MNEFLNIQLPIQPSPVEYLKYLDELLTIEEVAQRSRVCTKVVRNWIRDGLGAIKTGHVVRIRRRDVLDYENKNPWFESSGSHKKPNNKTGSGRLAQGKLS